MVIRVVGTVHPGNYAQRSCYVVIVVGWHLLVYSHIPQGYFTGNGTIIYQHSKCMIAPLPVKQPYQETYNIENETKWPTFSR